MNQYAASIFRLQACRSVEYDYILLHSAPELTNRQSCIFYILNLNTYLSGERCRGILTYAPGSPDDEMACFVRMPRSKVMQNSANKKFIEPIFFGCGYRSLLSFYENLKRVCVSCCQCQSPCILPLQKV